MGIKKTSNYSDHRKQRLIELLAVRCRNRVNVCSELSGINASQVSQYKRGHVALTEKMVGRIEDRLDVPGWFDHAPKFTAQPEAPVEFEVLTPHGPDPMESAAAWGISRGQAQQGFSTFALALAEMLDKVPEKGQQRVVAFTQITAILARLLPHARDTNENSTIYSSSCRLQSINRTES